ncbi:hypothetical protein GOODEAATRI_003397 [Goodea atripinnis]|uniref:HNF-p1 domain-containing protein n=1 Tax=Goodea atripinnis TaxID=208336 RepID=A0ABV0MYD3_9TELE
MLSRMFQQSEEPRFTIEQIDLLQRLRRTGISQVEVLHALDTLDHLDRQNGHKQTRKASYLPPSSSLSSSNSVCASSSTTSTSTQTVFPDNRVSLSPGNNLDITSPPLPVPLASPVVVQNGLTAVANGKLSPPRRDSSVIKEEIKSFLANRRISQAVVAQVTGATMAMRAAPLALEDVMDWHQTPPPFASAPGGFRLRRGSRFTWRKECLAVMERILCVNSFFTDNQYPDEAKREEIATACNAVIQKPGIIFVTLILCIYHEIFSCITLCIVIIETLKQTGSSSEISCLCFAGKKLSDLERVTSLKVYNWFANRRKDIKRRANIGNVPPQLPSWFSALARGGTSGQRSASQIGRSLVSGSGSQAEGSRLTGVSWSPSSPTLQDESGLHSVLSEPQDLVTSGKTAASRSSPASANQADGAGCSVGNQIKMEDD